eukprot:Phypoly_transcript_02370.p1 GENE.Phypoly_transcript_02370~~Phypoly_transcript_02370.p1  ORF type:complete len:875 (+),score=91.90 Phypoly_transcript_02370:378-2627(+)
MELHKDILKVDVTEGTLTSNSEMLWETFVWLRDNLRCQYFLKTDHDSFLRLDVLSEELFKLPIRKYFWSGFVWKHEPPIYAGEFSYKLDNLPPYAAGKTFYISQDIVHGLAEAKPKAYLPDEGHSMAIWLLPFKISPEHDPRFQPIDTCTKKLLSKSNLALQSMRSMYHDANVYNDPCNSFSRANCPLCFECETYQPHWTLRGIKCDSTGAVKSKPGSSAEENPTKEVLGFLPLLPCENRLIEDEDTPTNLVKGGKAPDSTNWEFFGNVREGNKMDGSYVSLSVYDSGPTDSYITQEINVKQTRPEAVVLAGWSKAESVEHTNVGDYCLLADFTYNDGEKANPVTLDFTGGTHDWEYNVRVFDPPKPIDRMSLRLLLRVTTGTVWFSNISVRNLTTALCDLKRQSTYFGAFRPAVLPDLRAQLRNVPITLGGLPRESQVGIAAGRDGLVDFHIHAEEAENGQASARDTTSSRFVAIWTSPVNTFKLRNRRVLESIFFHHPNAHLVVYSNVLPLYFFHEFNSAGYDVQVERYDLSELAKGLPGVDWVKDLPKWESGEFFYSHLSDFLRFVILYRQGGVYTDLDSILLRPINMPNVIVAEVCGSGGCSQDGDKSMKSKYYVPTGFMAFTANHTLLLESLAHFDTDYDPTVRHCGSMYLSQAYTKQAPSLSAEEVSVLSVKAFYPIPEKEIAKYFTQDNPERWQSIITGENYAFHFWGTLTHNVSVGESSLMRRALSSFSISNQRDVANLQF